MKVSELIELLKEMPQNVDVMLWSDVDAEIELEHFEESDIVEECVMLRAKYDSKYLKIFNT